MVQRLSRLVLLPAAFVASVVLAHAQTELNSSETMRIHELQESLQGVLLPLDGVLDPPLSDLPEPEAEPVQLLDEAELAPGADQALADAMMDMEVQVTVAVSEAEDDAQANDTETSAESLAELSETTEIVAAGDTGSIDEPEVDLVPGFAELEGVVDAELGNPDSIGPYRLWLATSGTQQESKAQWRYLASNNQDLLEDLRAIIVVKEWGEEGTYFRLQAGPLPSEEAARERCDVLDSRDLYCVVLGPEGT